MNVWKILFSVVDDVSVLLGHDAVSHPRSFNNSPSECAERFNKNVVENVSVFSEVVNY